MDVVIEWDGAKDEALDQLLVKVNFHKGPARDSLNSHLIAVHHKVRLVDTLNLLVGSSLAQNLQTSPAFVGFLSIAIIAMLSPRDLRLIPDSAGEILKIFEMRGFYRTIRGQALFVLLGDSKLAREGMHFLVENKFIEKIEGDTYRLLEVPLTNIKIRWTP